MNTTGFRKLAAVLAGYAVAFVAAWAGVQYRLAHTQAADRQASAGMHAFGDAMLFVGVFGLAAVIPTGMALWFLRPFRPFWTGLSIVACALAATGPVAAALIALSPARPPGPSPAATWELLAVLRMFAVPPLAAAFGLCALAAPERRARILLLVAAGLECVVGASMLFHWFVSSHVS